jgi:hypothetical protein
MENVHEMMLADEIVTCGVITLIGLVAGAVCRLVWSLLRRSKPATLETRS